MMTPHVIFSERKTVSLSVRNGELIIKCPRGTSQVAIDALCKKHERWIHSRLQTEPARMEQEARLAAWGIDNVKREAKQYFTAKAKEFAEKMGLKYSRVKITSAKTRFGSCSSRGNICFSYRLMLYPEAARDYVVVHELAHLLEMNHSRRFYSVIEKYMPDYKERKSLLK